MILDAPLTDSQDSSSLLDRLAAGDEELLASLFSRHHDRLWRLVSYRLDSRLAGRVDEDDVLQEAFMDASQRVKHLEQQRPDSAFLWLRLIVLQTLVNVHRRHLGVQMRSAQREVSLRNSMRSSSVNLAARLLDNLTSPSLAAMRAELNEQLLEALESLSEIDREVLALRHFEELTNQEVASVLGLQPKAASIRYVRALRRLQQVLHQAPGWDDYRQSQPASDTGRDELGDGLLEESSSNAPDAERSGGDVDD